MATTKNKKSLPIKEVIFAGAGGAAAGALTNVLEDNITFFGDRPNLVPLTIIAGSLAGIYFLENDDYNPLFYGMIGSAGNDLSNFLMDGMSAKSNDQTKAIEFEGSLEDFLLENIETQQLPAGQRDLQIDTFEDDFLTPDQFDFA